MDVHIAKPERIRAVRDVTLHDRQSHDDLKSGRVQAMNGESAMARLKAKGEDRRNRSA
jgi:hypothetical protein